MKDRIPDKELWRKVPIEVLIEEERKKKEIEDSWKRPQPTIHDEIPYNPSEEKKKEPGRGVVEIQFKY